MELATWILVRWQLPTGALLAMVLNGFYAMGIIVTLMRGLDLPNCGCDGVFSPQPLRWYSPLAGFALVGLSSALRVGAQASHTTLDKVS